MKKPFKDALDAGQIEPAKLANGEPFIIGGVQYYQATENGFNLSIGRFHAFGDTLRRHDELKLTDDLLTTAFDTLESYFKRCRAQATLDADQVLDAAQEGLVLIGRLKERRTLGLSVEQVYEIASIFYFCEDEDPGTVDSAVNRKKIKDWISHDEAGALFSFFFRSPIGAYMPVAQLFEPNTLNYLREVNIQEVLDWTRTLLPLKTSGLSPETMSIIESRRETLFGLDGLFASLLNRTSILDQPGSGPNGEK